MSDEFQKVGPGGRRVVMDELLIRSELYNKSEFDVVFFRDKRYDEHVRAAGITLGPESIVCRSREFCILPTSYYVSRVYDKGHAGEPDREIHDEPVQFIRNYGDNIGKGNKLPSNPEVKVIRRRRI